MIGVGIVGCNYGRTVLVPAFRYDPRCEVIVLAGTETARTAALARAANVGRAFGEWEALVEEPSVAAVAVAVPPHLQPAIARRASTILDDGTIGRLYNVVVTWNFENEATRLRLDTWKTHGNGGGGLLGNLVSHCFYNLEWLCGPISGLSAQVPVT
jgi:predicted dehydrogenase